MYWFLLPSVRIADSGHSIFKGFNQISFSIKSMVGEKTEVSTKTGQFSVPLKDDNIATSAYINLVSKEETQF